MILEDNLILPRVRPFPTIPWMVVLVRWSLVHQGRRQNTQSISLCVSFVRIRQTKFYLLPGLRAKKSLLYSAKIRQDITYNRIAAIENFESQIIQYHRSCMQKYTNKSTLPTHTEAESTTSSTSHFQPGFCIICSKKSHKGVRNLGKIQDRERFNNLVATAERRNDLEMIQTLDGVDFESTTLEYHRNCISSYLSKTNIAWQPIENPYDKAFVELLSEIDADILVARKAMFMSTLLNRYKHLLAEYIEEPAYKSYRLENRLLDHYGDSVTIQKQQGQGMSNIVFEQLHNIGRVYQVSE